MGEWTPLALVALLSLIPLSLYVAWAKRPQQAVLVVVFAAALFGPEGAFLKLPLIPPLDKVSLPYLILFLVALVRWRPRLARAKLWRGPDLLLVLAMVGGFVTMATNGDDLTYGSWISVTLPGLVINDGIQLGFSELLRAGLPFMLGRALFRTRRDLIELMHFLVVAGLVQTLFIWIELRMSPQFHGWVYGYGAHSDFLQTIRWGGYRPMVFMAHGLALALFMLVAFLSSLVLFKLDVPIRKWSAKRVAIYLGVVLILCKSTGAILYALLLAPLILKLSIKAQMRAAVFMVSLVAVYPALRAFDLFPTEQLHEWAMSISPERAQSMEFRFDNEEILLEKAREHLWFGWGGKGRRGVYDDELGKEIAIADGHWIIVFGMRGIVGFIQAFGLLIWPVIALRRRMVRFRAPPDQTLLAGFALIVAICTLDLVPNGLFSTYPYMLAGALLGCVHEQQTRPGSWAAPPASLERPRRRR